MATLTCSLAGTPRRDSQPRLSLLFGLAVLLAPAVAMAGKDEDALKERLAKVERALAGSGLVELVKQVESLQQEVRQLHGDLENQAFTIEQLRKSQRETYSDTDRRLSAMEQSRTGGAAAEPPLAITETPTDVAVAGKPSDQSIAVDIEPTPRGPYLNSPPPAAGIPGSAGAINAGATVVVNPRAAPPAAAPAVVAPTQPTAPPAVALARAASPARTGLRTDSAESETAYRDAFGMLKAGQYEQSITAFNNYLQQYPAGQYADNAQFWLGEGYYVLRQYEPAIAQYQKLVVGYPDSLKQSQAMLKIGYSYDKLGQQEQAASVLLQLKQKFPGSAAARLADEQLQRMRVKSP